MSLKRPTRVVHLQATKRDDTGAWLETHVKIATGNGSAAIQIGDDGPTVMMPYLALVATARELLEWELSFNDETGRRRYGATARRTPKKPEEIH